MYISNISINRINSIPDDVNFYHEYVDDLVVGELTFIRPIDARIKVLKVYEVVIKKNGKLKKGKCMAKYTNIFPNNGVVLDIYYAEGIPNRLIRWKMDYGFSGEFLFSENGFNGNVNLEGYNYKYNGITKLRKLVGLK